VQHLILKSLIMNPFMTLVCKMLVGCLLEMMENITDKSIQRKPFE